MLMLDVSAVSALPANTLRLTCRDEHCSDKPRRVTAVCFGDVSCAAEQHVVTVPANPPSFLIGDINHKEARLARNHGPPVAKQDRWRRNRRA